MQTGLRVEGLSNSATSKQLPGKVTAAQGRECQREKSWAAPTGHGQSKRTSPTESTPAERICHQELVLVEPEVPGFEAFK